MQRRGRPSYCFRGNQNVSYFPCSRWAQAMRLLALGLAACVIVAAIKMALTFLIACYLCLWVVALIVRPKEAVAFLTVFACVGVLKQQSPEALMVYVLPTAALIGLCHLLVAAFRRLD